MISDKIQQHFHHWLIGDNPLRLDHPSYIVNLELGVSIRFSFKDAFFADYDAFYNGIADVQFLRGDRPQEDELERILVDAYNFMAIVDRVEDELYDDDIDDSIAP